MPKVFATEWFFEAFFDNPTFVSKHMFGGKAAYLDGRLVACLMEHPDDEAWNGILIPTERDHHKSLLGEFSNLQPHPVLKKWLYLKRDHDEFDETALILARKISQLDFRFGVIPKPKKEKHSA